jgi:hypothetical protein
LEAHLMRWFRRKAKPKVTIEFTPRPQWRTIGYVATPMQITHDPGPDHDTIRLRAHYHYAITLGAAGRLGGPHG